MGSQLSLAGPWFQIPSFTPSFFSTPGGGARCRRTDAELRMRLGTAPLGALPVATLRAVCARLGAEGGSPQSNAIWGEENTLTHEGTGVFVQQMVVQIEQIERGQYGLTRIRPISSVPRFFSPYTSQPVFFESTRRHRFGFALSCPLGPAGTKGPPRPPAPDPPGTGWRAPNRWPHAALHSRQGRGSRATTTTFFLP